MNQEKHFVDYPDILAEPIKKKLVSFSDTNIDDVNVSAEKPPQLLIEAFNKLKKWANRGRYFKLSNYNIKVYNENGWWITLKLATNNNIYNIFACPRKPNQKLSDLYLGATMSSRRNRAGETWNRGNDLSDGKFLEKTWNKIVSDIVGAEMVKFQSDAWKN